MKLPESGGGPVLSWEGKRKPELLDYENLRPAVLMETFGCSSVDGVGTGDSRSVWENGNDSAGNLLFEGDNLAVMARLLADGYAGKVQLAYLDPPFGSGANYVRKIRLRGESVDVNRSSSETGSSSDGRGAERAGRAGFVGIADDDGLANQLQYTDQWSESSYLQFMYERLWMVRELLAENGSLYLHLDSNEVHAIKLICDEVFGPECFQRQIIWRIGWISGYKSAARNWIRNHDTILFYCKDPGKMIFNKMYLPYPEGYLRRESRGSSGKKGYPGKGYPLEDTWNCSAIDRMDSIQIKSFSKEKTSYPTQKNESLLERIILASSNPGDLVMDVFAGSGTTAAVAQKTGRRWIACDANHIAVQTINRRLQAIIAGGENGGGSGDVGAKGAAFSVWKIGGEDEGGRDGAEHYEGARRGSECRGGGRGGSSTSGSGELGSGRPTVSVSYQRVGTDVILEITGYANPEISKMIKKTMRTRTAGDGSGAPPDPDWRALIDWVSVDRDYDGRTFNVYLSDIPKDNKKCVNGHYIIPNVRSGAVIALKIIDILGHETLWVQ
ncbi:MAG: DNA methyltransferase [Bacillota bacterium]|jgi:DNA modification methylase